jgi:hypothetical protein
MNVEHRTSNVELRILVVDSTLEVQRSMFDVPSPLIDDAPTP